ncbi:MAG: hypothetical protein WAT19_08575 [Ferruginibacter sp.]
MKLRLKGNAVRLRLTKADIKELKEQGVIREHSHIADAVFTYELQQKVMEANLSASVQNNTVTVFINERSFRQLTATDTVGVSYIQQNENAPDLFLLVEKDFKCLDESPESQEDMYEHPGKSC